MYMNRWKTQSFLFVRVCMNDGLLEFERKEKEHLISYRSGCILNLKGMYMYVKVVGVFVYGG